MREITWSVKGALNVLLQSFSSTSIYSIGLQKLRNIVSFAAIFSNICTAHTQKRLFMNLWYEFRHRGLIRRPRFPIWVQNFVNLATFSVDFCISCAECPPYFYFRFVWPTDLESIPPASTPTSIIPTKFEAPKTIHSWVMSDNVSHWLPLRMRTRPLRMRRITWPVSRGSKTITFWNPWPWFAYSLYNFYWAMTTIKGRLLSSRPMLKPFLGEKILKSRRNGAQKCRFLGKLGSKP